MPEWDNTQGAVRWTMVDGKLVATIDPSATPTLAGATFTGNVVVDGGSDFREVIVKRLIGGNTIEGALSVQLGTQVRLQRRVNGVNTAALEFGSSGAVRVSKSAAPDTLLDIAARGSNGNGEYVKFYNGVMVAWRQTTYVGNVDASTNVPSGWRRTLEQTLTFPVAFVAEPTVTLQHTRKNGVTSDFYPAVYIHNNNASTTQAKYVIISPYGALTGVTLEVGYVAVGRWY